MSTQRYNRLGVLNLSPCDWILSYKYMCNFWVSVGKNGQNGDDNKRHDGERHPVPYLPGTNRIGCYGRPQPENTAHLEFQVVFWPHTAKQHLRASPCLVWMDSVSCVNGPFVFCVNRPSVLCEQTLPCLEGPAESHSCRCCRGGRHRHGCHHCCGQFQTPTHSQSCVNHWTTQLLQWVLGLDADEHPCFYLGVLLLAGVVVAHS